MKIKAVLAFIAVLICLYLVVHSFSSTPDPIYYEDCMMSAKNSQEESYCTNYPKSPNGTYSVYCAEKRLSDDEIAELYKNAIKDGVNTTFSDLKATLNRMPLCK